MKYLRIWNDTKPHPVTLCVECVNRNMYNRYRLTANTIAHQTRNGNKEKSQDNGSSFFVRNNNVKTNKTDIARIIKM